MKREALLFPIVRAVAMSPRMASLADRVLAPWNPFSFERYSDPYSLYEHVRNVAGPMAWQGNIMAWTVVGFDECEEVLRAPTVSVDRSEIIESVAPYRKMTPTDRATFTETLLLSDPPDHQRLRKLVNRAFSPRAIAELAPSIEKIGRSLLLDIEPLDRIEFMSSFAQRLPIFVIGDMLGFAEHHWQRLKAVSDHFAKLTDPINGFDVAAMSAAMADFRLMLDELIDERTRQPRNDIVSQLIEVADDGDRLSRTELESMMALLLVAGHETTSGMLGNALLALHHNPDQRARLIAEPGLIDNAVEELLRYDTSVQMTDRIATADFEVAGHHIKEGQLLGVMFGGANRDPRKFADPNTLQLDRDDPRSVSFGHGIHHCLGAALARLELQIALPLFLDAYPNYRVVEQDLEWKRTVTLRGPSRLPLLLND